MKTVILVCLFIMSTFASEVDELYKKALEYEEQKDYKKAMETYKQIAQQNIASTKEQPKKEIQKPEIQIEKSIVNAETSRTPDIVRREEFVNTVMSPLEDKESHETVRQIVSSTFDIYPYKANYFLPASYDTKERSDREQTETKFQISFRKPLSYNLFGLEESMNFAYTQTSWWQLYAESSPFRETNYKPEFFITFPYKKESALKAYKISFLHESNGQDGEDSRSWNRLYLEGYFQHDNLFITPRVWYRIPESSKNDDNPDIDDYLGYGDITFMFPYKRNTFKLKLRNNLDFSSNRSGTEFEYSFPLTSQRKSVFGFLQIFSGYGESLIDYNKHMNKISIGLAISR